MQNERTAAGDSNKRIQVERHRGSMVEIIKGTASQIARYDNHLNGTPTTHSQQAGPSLGQAVGKVVQAVWDYFR
ncbi:hypothetical protein L3X38_000087 [Prunus dulcis]|uniref:Uncharacterized protein n=1 Tax=Prunus dulcis TaxID=3755 RepID=A0AAD4UQA8_PRUDU|nr:hypothetical protein L3X38_000087 [Prunus dulcis]